jgi:hypothetical protein
MHEAISRYAISANRLFLPLACDRGILQEVSQSSFSYCLCKLHRFSLYQRETKNAAVKPSAAIINIDISGIKLSALELAADVMLFELTLARVLPVEFFRILVLSPPGHMTISKPAPAAVANVES